jgi:hypothetical protein
MGMFNAVILSSRILATLGDGKKGFWRANCCQIPKNQEQGSFENFIKL